MEAQSRPVHSVLFWGALICMIALYVYEVIAAIGNWQGMSQVAEMLSDGLSTQGIVWLSIGIALPIVALATALLAGRTKSRAKRLLILVLGLSLVAVFKLDILYFVPTTSYLGNLAI